jgi:hypothetical protein
MRPLFAVLLLAGAAQARPRRVESGPLRASILELYTSEGCSSCPPADELVNGMPGRFPGRLLPLAFHVDYWDEIGWPDRFADARWTARQRARSARLYTPELMINGRELTDRRLELPSAPPRASLVLDLDGNRVTATATGGERLYLALSESNLVVDVKAGENRGRTLRHDHVVRALYGPFPAGRPALQALTLDPAWKTANLSLTAFVEDAGGEILQAVRLPLAE